MTLSRTAFVLGAILIAVVVGTFAAVKLTTDRLLFYDATATARDWARYLVRNIEDLENIAAGDMPGSPSLAFFQRAQDAGIVFRFEIYNRTGFSQMTSARDRTEMVGVATFSAEAAQAIATREPVVAFRSGGEGGTPDYYGVAHIPVFIQDRPVAVVAAFVDQSEARERFYKTFMVAALGLCLFVALAFAVPVGLWYIRSREKQKADAELHFLAKHDPLTGLVNRKYLAELLAEALARAAALGTGVAVHYIDLDRFKVVNDTLGHPSGDALLKAMAERLSSLTRPGDIVARLGGDEFAVVQHDLADRASAEALAARMLALMARPFELNGHDLVTTGSVGVAVAPDDGRDADRLLKSADLALYRSKGEGRNRVRFFTREMDAELHDRLALERRLRRATEDEKFELYYQPVVRMPDGRTTGFEALLRMRDDDGVMVSPAIFVPVAEDMGLIGRIGAWVLHTACRAAAHWPRELKVAVNVSPAQFEAGNLYDVVASALRASGLAPHRLEIEITESLLLRDADSVISELHRLKALGVDVVMDDFGTGYSSLSYLWRFPFDKIKIDQSFMKTLDRVDKNVETIVRTIVGLGHSLQMDVTVEGVEDPSQADIVRAIGCDCAQGFHFAAPMPLADLSVHLLRESMDHHEPATSARMAAAG